MRTFFDRKPGSYTGRFNQFAEAIRAAYPSLQLIATEKVDGIHPDLIDDHYYRSALQFYSDTGHYDHFDRNGPKVFVGEWATREGSPTPDMNAALGDAAWMTGMGEEFRHHHHVLLRAALRQRESGSDAVADRPDRLRRDDELRLAVLLRPENVQPEPRRLDPRHVVLGDSDPDLRSRPRRGAAEQSPRRRRCQPSSSMRRERARQARLS